MPPAELRRRFAAGGTYASIARECGVGENAVRYRARKLAIREFVNMPVVPAPSAPALRLALSHSDITLKAIAAAFGCHPSTVSRVAREYGLPTDSAGRAALMGAR